MLTDKAFALYDEDAHFMLETGDYEVSVGMAAGSQKQRADRTDLQCSEGTLQRDKGAVRQHSE